MKILAIESSCDETAAAVISVAKDGPAILSNIVSSQVDLHAKTGGVVPEVASRAHLEAVIPVVTEALTRAKYSKSEIRITNIETNEEKFRNLEIKDLDIVSNFDVRYSNLQKEIIDYLKNNISHIAVTAGPGLIGSLLVGFNAAKSIAYALDKPIIPINHIEGHIYSALAAQIPITKKQVANKSHMQNSSDQNLTQEVCYQIREFKFPLLALVVSGGHTSLILMRDHGQYEIIGETLDDAAGEAFDKVAKLLDLGYPGGPVISKLASKYRENPKQSRINNKLGNSKIVSIFGIRYSDLVFPRPLINDGTFNFSFSGLKTAVLYEVKKRSDNQPLATRDKQEIATAFEDAVVDVLVTKTLKAVEKYKPKTVVLAGGVSANTYLRHNLKNQISNIKNKKIDLLVPPIELCGDNAAMIGLAACYHVLKGDVSSWDKIKVDSNWELVGRWNN